jgi:hypothetical protein
MANFVFVSGSGNPPGYVNIDLVRRASEGIDGALTLHFGPGDELVLHGADAMTVITEVKKHWPDRANAA